MMPTGRAVKDLQLVAAGRLDTNPWRWCSIPPAAAEALNKVVAARQSRGKERHRWQGLLLAA